MKLLSTTLLFSLLLVATFYSVCSAGRIHQQHQHKRRFVGTAPATVPLNDSTITLSGFDGGASFGSQYHIAFSSQFRGAAFLSLIPYLCAEGTLAGSTTCLTDPILINNAALYTEALGLVTTGTADSFSYLANQYVRIGASPSDTLVNWGGSKAAAEMYSTFLGVQNVETDFDLGSGSAEHSWVTSAYGVPCSSLGPPYISQCKKSFALDSMNYLFRNIMGSNYVKPAASSFNQSHLYEFDQTKFGANPVENSLANTGYVYIPPQCQKQQASGKTCHFHVHFHGCNQSREILFSNYALQTQLNEFASANDVVVLYPQAAVNTPFLNPLGCFDFYGYEVDLPFPLAYASKVGGQMKIIQAMQQAFINGFE